MNTRRTLSLLLCALLCLSALPASAEVIDAMLATQAYKTYTAEEVSDDDLAAVLAAGAQSPSARNGQPWRFTVVRDTGILSELLRSENGLALIVSAQDGEQQGINAAFDCGLTTQSLYLAAQSLGLGANIYMSGVSQAEAMRDALGIPDGYTPIAILSIGHIDTDATTSASTRTPLSDLVNYVP